MPEKITSKQETRLGDLFVQALRTLNLSKEGAQEIIKNGGTLQLEVKPILKKLAIADKRFGPAIVEVDMTVPADYSHEKQIDQSAKKAIKEKTTYYFNDGLTSKNFANATNKLESGKTYRVKIIPILATVTSNDCLAHLRKQGAIFVGAQGSSLVYDLHRDMFPKEKWTVSLDEKEALWKDSGGNHRVPHVYTYPGSAFRFNLGFFEIAWDSDYCLLCFCDK